MTDHSIKGKTVIIAGGAKNLGGLIARDLAEQGVKAVAIHYNSEAARAEADATVIRSEAAAQRYKGDADGQRRANEAENILSDGARASRTLRKVSMGAVTPGCAIAQASAK